MTSPFAASFEGFYRPDSLATDFLPRLAARIQSGLFPMASPRRNQYEIVDQTGASMHFRSTGLAAGINIGLNEVRLRVDRKAGVVYYSVTYWTWAQYCIGLGLVLGVVLVVAAQLLLPQRGPANPLWVWSFAGFWCLLWPWVLIALHKRPAARCLRGIFEEVNSAAGPEDRP
jgi:hypothetical protein